MVDGTVTVVEPVIWMVEVIVAVEVTVVDSVPVVEVAVTVVLTVLVLGSTRQSQAVEMALAA